MKLKKYNTASNNFVIALGCFKKQEVYSLILMLCHNLFCCLWCRSSCQSSYCFSAGFHFASFCLRISLTSFANIVSYLRHVLHFSSAPRILSDFQVSICSSSGKRFKSFRSFLYNFHNFVHFIFTQDNTLYKCFQYLSLILLFML